MTSTATATLNGRYRSGSRDTTTTDNARSWWKEATERSARQRSAAARRTYDRQDLTDAYLDRTAVEAASMGALLTGFAGR